MRVCMRPVSLGRIIDITRITRDIATLTTNDTALKLGCSERHTVEILDEMCDMQLLEKDEANYKVTDNLESLREAIVADDWKRVHSIFLNHAHYRAYYEIICQKKSATMDELYELLQNQPSPKFNRTGVEIAADWAERIGSVQRNVLNGEIYPVLPERFQFSSALAEIYQELNYVHTTFLKQTYVEIPKLRETLCQRYKLPRQDFDAYLQNLIRKNIGIIELSGAPLTTHAKKTTKKIKHVSTLSYTDRLSMKLTSDQYLSGIEVNHRMYYYLACHGGTLHD